jgi:hypothetical protein
MRFAINLDMARAHGLNISSRLLDLAQYVLSSEALARTVPVSEGDPVTDRKSAGPAE